MSNTETGHVKNVANFNRLVSACTGFGTSYNPSNPTIILTALTAKYNGSNTALLSLQSGMQPLVNAVNNREIKFASLSSLSTRIYNALAASEGVTKEILDDARTIIRKIQGKRATPPKVDDPATPEDESLGSISSSQMSYDNRVSFLNSLIQLLTAQPGYNPNEIELTITELEAYQMSLADVNQLVIDSTTTVNNLRITRNTLLYAPVTGLCDIAATVKKYLKSVFGATSPQFKEVSSIKFRKYKI